MNETTECEQKTGIVCRADTESGNGKGDTAGHCQNRRKAEGAVAVHVPGESADFCGVRGEKQSKAHAIILHRRYSPDNE